MSACSDGGSQSPKGTVMASTQAMTYEQAKAIAQKHIRDFGEQYDYVLQDKLMIERPFGWVFFYAPGKYLHTGDPAYLRPGNGPFVVLRANGEVVGLPSSLPPEKAVEMFEVDWNEKQQR
jgi:hypothetical protein